MELCQNAESLSKCRVILNIVKNLNAQSGCNQILRVVQDDTMIGKFHYDTAPS